MNIFTITTLFLAALLCNLSEARPGSIVQESGSGEMTNYVSGSGSSATSYSESKTTVTDKDGNTIVSEYSITTSRASRHGKTNRNVFYYTVTLTSFLSFISS